MKSELHNIINGIVGPDPLWKSMSLMLGFPETTGLEQVALFP
jgi:hypothetical protein